MSGSNCGPYQPGDLLYRDYRSGRAWALLVEWREREIYGAGVFWTEWQWLVRIVLERSGESGDDWLSVRSLRDDWTPVGNWDGPHDGAR